MIKLRIILFLFLFDVYGVVYAQVNQLQYTQNFTIANGLCHNGVTSVLEDSEGYFWIGTYDGLARYNGYEFKIFKNRPNRKIITSNRIRTITEDKVGNLWIGTDDGISVYNKTREQFKNIFFFKEKQPQAKGPIVREILINKNNHVVCLTESNGIFIFDDTFTYKENIKLPVKSGEKSIALYNAVLLDSMDLVITSSGGLIHFNLQDKTLNWIMQCENNFESSVCSYNNEILLATLSEGISIFKYRKIAGRYHFFYEAIRLQTQEFACISIDHLKNLWIGRTDNGVIKIEGVDEFLLSDNFNSISFGESGLFRISAIATSEKFGCWVGTYNKGIFRFNLHQNPFKTYNPVEGNSVGIESSRVEQFCPIEKNKVLVKVQRGELALFNTISQSFDPLPRYISNLEYTNLSAFLIDSMGDTWVTYCNGHDLVRIRKGQNNIETIIHGDNPLPGFEVPTKLIEDNNGNIWLMEKDDVFRVKVDNNNRIEGIEALNDHPYFAEKKLSLLRTVYSDPIYNSVWLGTDTDGLFRIDYTGNEALRKLKVTQYDNKKENPLSIPSNFVTSVVRLSNGELWIGTERGGICQVRNSESEPEFISFNEEDGLSNNVVKSIIPDKNENLWISTNIGLNKLDLKTLQFRSFRAEDGLPFEDFFNVSAALDNGYLIFTGLTEFTFFDPLEIPENESLPVLRFSNFKVYNKTILPGDTVKGRVLLNESISDVEGITLKHNENVFSVDVDALHYSNSQNHYIRYKLLPINDDWIRVPSSQRVLNYNGLQPGEYKLQVMASNSLNQWTKPKILKIEIEPPFWVTTEAYVLYVVILSSIIFFVMFYILRMNRLRHNLEIEHLEREKVQEVNAAKLRFFSNISHEIKTPLTLITGPLSLMTERYRGNTELIDKLGIIQRQSKRISRLIDQVHDFQRSDVNKLKMDYQNFCFDDFFDELIRDFWFLADNENKKLIIKREKKKIFVTADKDKLEKIINNLFNNAFKYTKANDEIIVHYWVDKKYFHFEIKDTGRGIAPDDLPHIFERFYQSKHKHSEYTGGSGIGLAFTKRLVEMHYGYIRAESVLHTGTTFYLNLPIAAEIQSEDVTETENKILQLESQYEDRIEDKDAVDISRIKFDATCKGTTVFIAEDNTEMRRFISEILKNSFKIKAFNNGKELIEELENEWPDIIVSDVLMPELNGFELCRQVKSNIKTSHIPIILLTACTTIDEQLEGIRAGADAYIKKPFNLQHLVTRIEGLINSRKKLHERFEIDLPATFEKKEANENDITFIKKLYALMEEHLDDVELEIDELAQQLFLNRSLFFHKVKSITNQTPYELLKAYRLKRASQLLVEKQLSVKEVYMMTGFKSRSHFSKLFKEKYNITPGNYASEMLKK